jgi:hypothetical protein
MTGMAEKRRALDAWAAEVARIIDPHPAPADVVPLYGRGRRR